MDYQIISKSDCQLILRPEMLKSGKYLLTLKNGNEQISQVFIIP
jgi:hypothetical protein